LSEGLLSLRLHSDVYTRLLKALPAEHRGVPATPDHRQVRAIGFGGLRYSDGILDWRASQDRHAQAERLIQMRPHGRLRVILQSPIQDNDLIARRIQMRPDCQQ